MESQPAIFQLAQPGHFTQNPRLQGVNKCKSGYYVNSAPLLPCESDICWVGLLTLRCLTMNLLQRARRGSPRRHSHVGLSITRGRITEYRVHFDVKGFHNST